MNTDVIFSRHFHSARITLNRPEALHAIGLSIIEPSIQQLEQWKNDRDISCILLDSRRGKAFCAGGDIRECYHAQNKKDHRRYHLITKEYRLQYMLAKYDVPSIALMDGLTFGAGAGLSLHSGFGIGTQNTILAMPENRIGLFPDAGVNRLYAALPNFVGLYCGLSGHRLNISDLLNLSLIRYAIDEKAIGPFMEKISRQAHIDHDVIFSAIHAKNSPLTPNELPKPTLGKSELSWIADTFCGDLISIVNKIEAEAKSCKTIQPFAVQCLQSIQNASPLSLCICHKILTSAVKNLQETFANDEKWVKFCLDEGDFYEGVRALIIDKDYTPKWRFQDIHKAANYFDSQYSP